MLVILESLIAILEADAELKILLNATESISKISPDFSMNDGIAYTFYDVTNDKIKTQAQFSLTIINDDLLKAYKIKNRVDEMLLTFSDEQPLGKILKIVQNGGGQYFDETLNVRKIKTTYIVTYRKD